MFHGWKDLIQRRLMHKNEFVSADARRFSADPRTYEMLSGTPKSAKDQSSRPDLPKSWHRDQYVTLDSGHGLQASRLRHCQGVRQPGRQLLDAETTELRYGKRVGSANDTCKEHASKGSLIHQEERFWLKEAKVDNVLRRIICSDFGYSSDKRSWWQHPGAMSMARPCQGQVSMHSLYIFIGGFDCKVVRKSWRTIPWDVYSIFHQA